MSDLVTTRRSLHAVAELLLAGPQYAESGTIKLTPMLNGFGCVDAPGARVKDGDLLLGSRFAHLDGRTIADVGRELGLEPRSLGDVYSDCVDLALDHVLSVDREAADDIADAFEIGDAALRAFAPESAPVLWPEHFDLGITVSEVNYGVSPGDGYLEVPYAYVGPWSLDTVEGDFWNAPFGAALPLSDIDNLAFFFSQGADLLAR